MVIHHFQLGIVPYFLIKLELNNCKRNAEQNNRYQTDYYQCKNFSFAQLFDSKTS